jgi:SanA protein
MLVAMPPLPSKIKKVCVRFLIVFLALFIVTLGINQYLVLSAKNRIYRDVSSLPIRETELILGTEPIRPDGSTNLHFLKRTDIAAKAYFDGKAMHLLISGNRNNRGFNEVLEMKNKFLANNVPEAALQLDFDGTRTYESIRRAKEIYHLNQIIVVTDAFHAPRALFLCRHFGIDAIALCPSGDPFGWWYLRYNVREYFARLIAVFDILKH